MLLQAAKYIGAGLATIGLAGAGVGIGTGASEKSIPLSFFVDKKHKNVNFKVFDLKYFNDSLITFYLLE
jgi:hypothetical protein